MSKSIYVFTKTNWDESPRIRHQITNMLLKRGYEIYFFEKPRLSILKNKRVENGLRLFNTFEFLHHQLRPFKPLIWINKILTKYYIKSILKKEKHPDVILNFNYDYYFLREVFPNKKIITIINDDFIDMARPWMKSAARYQLEKTSKNSDYNLALSYPLVNQIKTFTCRVELFLPWAENEYKIHKEHIKKDTVLWWGYIRYDIDWEAIEFLLKNKIKILMVGPIESKKPVDNILNKLKGYSNFELKESTSLDKLDFSNICCSLLSYRKDVEYDRATTISNRGFNLLSNGIPLVYANLPNLISAPKDVITKCNTNEEYLEAICYFQHNLIKSQVSIKIFLEKHYEENRFIQLSDSLC